MCSRHLRVAVSRVYAFRPIDLVREDLRSQFRSNAHVVNFIAELHPGLGPRDVEEVLRDISGSLDGVGRALGRAAPSMLQGAITGAAAGAAGGLPGILAGAAIGAGARAATHFAQGSGSGRGPSSGTASGGPATGSRNRPSAGATRPGRSSPTPGSQISPSGGSGSTPGGRPGNGPNPALMFSSVLGQPSVRTALAANALLGPYGVRSVSVSGNDVSVNQLVTLVAILAGLLLGRSRLQDDDGDDEATDNRNPFSALDDASAETLAYLIAEASAGEAAAARAPPTHQPLEGRRHAGQ